MIEFLDETGIGDGTPLNRINMMALQGFDSVETKFNNDGSITQTNSRGQTYTTSTAKDGSIIETFVGEKTIVKTTKFNEDGSISEEISWIM